MPAFESVSWHDAGRVAVDSGCLLLIDPIYQRPSDACLDLALRSGELPCNEVALSERQLHCAFACNTGIGDGVYPVQVRLAPSPLDGLPVVAEIRVLFLGEPDECGA